MSSLDAVRAGRATCMRNAIGGATSAQLSGRQRLPDARQWLADFVDRRPRRLSLVVVEFCRKAPRTDGTDIGVDFATLNAAMTDARARDGSGGPGAGAGAARRRSRGTPVALPGRSRRRTTTKAAKASPTTTRPPATAAAPIAATTSTSSRRPTSSGAYNVKSVRAGEWLDYTVNVAAAGTLRARLARRVERHRRHGASCGRRHQRDRRDLAPRYRRMEHLEDRQHDRRHAAGGHARPDARRSTRTDRAARPPTSTGSTLNAAAVPRRPRRSRGTPIALPGRDRSGELRQGRRRRRLPRHHERQQRRRLSQRRRRSARRRPTPAAATR